MGNVSYVECQTVNVALRVWKTMAVAVASVMVVAVAMK